MLDLRSLNEVSAREYREYQTGPSLGCTLNASKADTEVTLAAYYINFTSISVGAIGSAMTAVVSAQLWGTDDAATNEWNPGGSL